MKLSIEDCLEPYVISLKYPKDLFAYLQERGLNPQFVKGIDGRSELKSDPKLYKHVTPMYSRFGPLSAIGCALSHMKAWRMFLQSDSEYALVLEDDVVMDVDFVEKLRNVVDHVPSDFDIFYLGCFGSASKSIFFTLNMGWLGLKNDPVHVNDKVRVPPVALALHAYIVSKKGAQTLLDNLDGKIYYHLDFCIQALSKQHVIKTYVAEPRLVYQTSTDTLTSLNVSSNHPILLNNMLSHIQLDTKVRANYMSTLSLLKLGVINANLMSVAFLLVGMICAFVNVPRHVIIYLFILISAVDLANCAKTPSSLSMIAFHMMLLLMPSLMYT
jgi:glycosyl transferase family 25